MRIEKLELRMKNAPGFAYGYAEVFATLREGRNKMAKSANIWAVVYVVAVCAMVLVGGCEKGQNTTAGGGSTKIISEEMGLKARVEQLQKENEQLKQQVGTLATLPVDKRAEALYHVERVDIGRFSNIYEEDNGKKKSLVVYVQPVDETGDVVKAAGAVEVQLWDLNKPENRAMVGEWKVEPNESTASKVGCDRVSS